MRPKYIVSIAALLCVSFVTLGVNARPSSVAFKEPAVSTSEKKLIGQINQPRAKAGKNLFKLDYTLCGIAKKRAQAYSTMQSFIGNIPGLGTLERMVAESGLKALALDEYVSRSQPEQAVSGWMANGGSSVLDDQFNYAGAGIVEDGDKSLSVVIFAKTEASAATPAPTPLPSPSPEPGPAGPAADVQNSSTPSVEATPTPSAQGSASPVPSQAAVLEPARATDGTPSEVEVDFLNQLNKQRSSNGVAQLAFEKNAQKAAQSRAWEVSDTAKYTADSPTYGDLKSLLKSFNVSFNTCAQALTRGGGTASAIKTLLKSPTYQKLLLSKSYEFVGVGISSRDSERIYIIYLTN